ncbi:MAG: hypothetical protein VCA35_05890 [Roseibacillus sp.]
MAEEESNDPAPEEGSPSKQMPEGMRVVRKHRKKRESSPQTLFLKKREILREILDEGGVVSVKEQVARLKSAQKAKDGGKPVEERWGGQKSSQRGGRWFLLRVFALLVPVLAIITAFIMMKVEKGRELVDRVNNELNLDLSESDQVFEPAAAIAWFIKNPHIAIERSVEVMDKLNVAEAGEIPEAVFRNGGFARAQIAKHGLGWSSDFFTGDPRMITWSFSRTGETGYLVAEGVRADQRKFRSYFVKTADGVRMDWAASMGWSEHPMNDLVVRPPEKDVLVRCVMAKEPHYDTLRGPASLHSWYLLRSPSADSHVWAFVPAGSPLDDQLLDLFDFGRMVLERKSIARVILRISKPQIGAKADQFEIEELITKEWVMP